MSSSSPGDDVARALAVATRWLRTGVRSTHEVRSYLTGRRVRPGAITRVVSECRRRGLLDDRACARLWADHWARRGYAWAAIRQRLAMKGLPEAAIDAAAARTGAMADAERARHAAEHWCRRPSARRSPVRLGRFLAARGFDESVIEHVVAETYGATLADADAAER